MSDMEIWPGHWRTIGRILEMKGLCRANSAVSLVENDIRDTYGPNRPADGSDPRYTPSLTGTDEGPAERWRHILPESKALNLFEAYIRLKWEICFECGASAVPGDREKGIGVFGEKGIGKIGKRERLLSRNMRFFVQTDIHGGMVYVCCRQCGQSVFQRGPKPSCDSIPYTPPDPESCAPQGFLVPYARMIQMDLFPLSTISPPLFL